MNAVPLTDPSGVVRGWMCGVCLHPGGGSDALVGQYTQDQIDSAQADAERCCTCWTCGIATDPNGERGRSISCGPCEAALRAKQDAEMPAAVPTAWCDACRGSGEVACKACNGAGEMPL